MLCLRCLGLLLRVKTIVNHRTQNLGKPLKNHRCQWSISGKAFYGDCPVATKPLKNHRKQWCSGKNHYLPIVLKNYHRWSLGGSLGGLCVGHASWGCSWGCSWGQSLSVIIPYKYLKSHNMCPNSKVAAVPDGYLLVPDGYPPVPEGYPPVPDGYPYKG